MWLVLPAIFVAALLAFFLYYKDKKLGELSKTLTYCLMTIRFIVLFFILFFLLSPVIKYLQYYFDTPIIIIAQDKSESIGLSKKNGNHNNADYLNKVKNFVQDLNKEYKTEVFSFGENLTKGISSKFEDKETNFASLFDEINSNYVNYNIGALVIASDGIYNKGPNPVYMAKEFPFPIYTIALGDTTRKRDIILKNAYANKIAFLGDFFPAEVTISCFGYQNQDINLAIYNKGKEIQRQTIHVDRNDFSKQLTLDLSADVKGLQSYLIKIDKKEGEFDFLNNSKELIVDVVDDKKKILILANSVHPDISAIKNALESNKNLLVESYVFDDFKGNVSDYQLVIFHQLPSQQNNIQKVFAQLNQKFIPAMFIIGSQTEVQNFNSLKTGLSISGNNHLLEQSAAYVNSGFKLFEIDDKFNELINEFPPVFTPFGNYVNEGQMDILFFQQIKNIKTQKPLLCFSSEKPGIKGKYAFFIGDGIWRWRMQDFLKNENHQQFDAFINKIVHFLALDVQKDRFMIYHNRIFNENEEINFRAEFYNKSYELNNSSDIALQLTNSENKEYNYQFSKTANSYSLNTGRLPIGNYKYQAKLKFEGNEFSKSGEFKVVELNVEHQDLTANHALLHQLAVQSNGKMFYANQLDELKKELKTKDTIKPISRSIIDLVDLIELKWVFFLLILLLSIEWFLRKFYGSY